MTKTMEINELISELKEYDGELTVKVWSNGANNAYPISHVGQGHTDGVLDTYVGIVIDDDSNLVDLSMVNSEEEEAFCAVIDYCNCGICVKSGKCQLSPQHMCLKGRAYYEGFIEGAKLYKGCVQWADEHPKNVWHDASEEPKGTYIVLCDGLDDSQWVVDYLHIDMSYANWKDYAESIRVNRWAYVSDLLPKGGEK